MKSTCGRLRSNSRDAIAVNEMKAKIVKDLNLRVAHEFIQKREIEEST
jgi:hypothetical protein